MKKRPSKRAGRAQQPTAERGHACETASTRRSRAQLVAEVEKGLCEIAGVTTRPLANFLVDQVAKLQPWLSRDADRFRAAMCLLGEIGPKNATEALLAVQMVGVHNAATFFLAQAVSEGHTRDGADVHVLRATRLMRLFNEQLGAMAKLRGTAGQQRVTVEHVHVNAGGQAIVGAVSARKGSREGG